MFLIVSKDLKGVFFFTSNKHWTPKRLEIIFWKIIRIQICAPIVMDQQWEAMKVYTDVSYLQRDAYEALVENIMIATQTLTAYHKAIHRVVRICHIL